MNSSFTPCSTVLLVLTAVPRSSSEIEQLAEQFNSHTQHVVTDFAYHGLLVSLLLTATSLFFGTLLLILQRTSLQTLRLTSQHHTIVQRHFKTPAETHIAKANRQALRLASAWIRAGHMSN